MIVVTANVGSLIFEIESGRAHVVNKRVDLAAPMRQLTAILTGLTLATIHTHAGSLDWLFDVANNDNIARTEAQSLGVGWCAASPLSAFREGRHRRQRLAFLSLSC